MSDDKVVAVKSEVQRLLDASMIREVMCPKWLANTVPIKKKNGKWRPHPKENLGLLCPEYQNRTNEPASADIFASEQNN
jgi:hypothetical protein